MLSIDLCDSRRSSSQKNHRSFRFASSSWVDHLTPPLRFVVRLLTCLRRAFRLERSRRLLKQINRQCGILKRHHETGSVEKKPRSGQPRKSTPRNDRHLKALSLANRFKTVSQLRDEWSDDSAVDVSARTVRRRLISAGPRGCVALKKPFISARNKKRLQFARNHRNWTVEDWSRVL